MSAAPEPGLFPVFVRLAGRKVVLVGGGKVAEAKLRGLLEAGAQVTVVAPEVSDAIASAAVRVVRRPFQSDDVNGAWLVIAAAPPEVNREALAAGEARGVFVNAVDDPAHGSVYTGGVLRRGGITVAISTEGRAPALAGLLREALEAAIPEEVGDWVAAAAALRRQQKLAGTPIGERRPQLLQTLNRIYAGRAKVVR